MLKKIVLGFALGFAMLVGVIVPMRDVLAADNACDIATAEEKKLLGCDGTKTADSFAEGLINVAASISGIVAVCVMIYGGITMTTSMGDPTKVKRGRSSLVYGLAGLIVVILAYAIANFVIKAVV